MYLQQASTGPLSLTEEIDGFLLRHPKPSSSEISEFLKLYVSGAGRDAAARTLIARGVDQRAVANALAWLEATGRFNWGLLWSVLSTASMALGAYHGYRRNQSVGWAIWWGLMGLTFPVITPAIAAAQGFGKRKGA